MAERIPSPERPYNKIEGAYKKMGLPTRPERGRGARFFERGTFFGRSKKELGERGPKVFPKGAGEVLSSAGVLTGGLLLGYIKLNAKTIQWLEGWLSENILGIDSRGSGKKTFETGYKFGRHGTTH